MVFGTQAAFRWCAILCCVLISLNYLLFSSVEMPLKVGGFFEVWDMGGFLEIFTSFLFNKRMWLVKIVSSVKENLNKQESIAFFCLVFCWICQLNSGFFFCFLTSLQGSLDSFLFILRPINGRIHVYSFILQNIYRKF